MTYNILHICPTAREKRGAELLILHPHWFRVLLAIQQCHLGKSKPGTVGGERNSPGVVSVPSRASIHWPHRTPPCDPGELVKGPDWGRW